MKAFCMTIFLIVSQLLGFSQELPIPQGLSAEIVKNDSGRYIQLVWNKGKDLATPLGYNLLVKFPYSSSLLLYQKAGVIYDTVYHFPIHDEISSSYKFALMSIKNFPAVVRSKACDAIQITIPSTSLPNIKIIRRNQQKGEITLFWEYDSAIPDLDGYNIYLHDKLIDKVTSPDQMYWSGKFTKNGSYIFEISAVTASGIESRRSQRQLIKVE